MRLCWLLLLLQSTQLWADARFAGSYIWAVDDPRFGGFSAIEMRDEGRAFLAITDRGHIAQGRFDRQGDTIAAMHLDSLQPLLGPTRAPLADGFSDSEGLALADDDSLYISFEGRAGVRRFAVDDRLGGRFLGSDLSTSPLFDKLQTNSGLEALAIAADGTLFAIPERSGQANRAFPVWRYRNGQWDQAFTLPRQDAFLVVGADIGPDGRFYVLERDFLGIGFRSRVRRFDMTGGQETIIMQSTLRTYDNLEGISIWLSTAGLRMTLIADDNFRSFQQTQIVEYALTD